MALQQDGAGKAAGVTGLAWRLGCGMVAAFALLVLLQRLGLGDRSIEAGFLALGLASAAALAALAGARATASGDRSAPTVLRGLALATDSISAPFFLGLAGAVFVWGHDGLAFVLGLGAGYLLLQLLIAPLLPEAGAHSVPDYVARRFGRAPRVLAGVVVIVSMGVLLVAELQAAALITARLLGLELVSGLAVAAPALLACFALRRMAATPWLRGALFPLMLLAFLAPAVALSFQIDGQPVPQIAYAKALWQIQGLEETLLENDLADPVGMKPVLTPFLSLSPLNSFGLVLGLALGVACLPNLLSRHFMAASTRAARWSAVWALAFAALFLSAVPALAVYAKLALLTQIAEGTALAELPAWIFAYGRLGLVEICGRAASDAAAAAGACAALSDAASVLRLQDLQIAPEVITLAAPEMTGLGPILLGALGASALAAALVTADGPLLAVLAALGLRAEPGAGALGAARLAPYTAAAGAVLLAALAAATRPAGFLTVATWALTLAASGLFPVLLAGLWWQRANAYGAVAGMATGLAVALFYLVGTRYFAVGFFEVWQDVSSAGPTANETFAELKQAWAATAPGPAREAAWAALDAHAQAIANWWGIKPVAAGLLALPAGAAAVIAVSLLTPRPRPETAS